MSAIQGRGEVTRSAGLWGCLPEFAGPWGQCPLAALLPLEERQLVPTVGQGGAVPGKPHGCTFDHLMLSLAIFQQNLLKPQSMAGSSLLKPWCFPRWPRSACAVCSASGGNVAPGQDGGLPGCRTLLSMSVHSEQISWCCVHSLTGWQQMVWPGAPELPLQHGALSLSPNTYPMSAESQVHRVCGQSSGKGPVARRAWTLGGATSGPEIGSPGGPRWDSQGGCVCGMRG